MLTVENYRKKDLHARAYGRRPDLLEAQTTKPCYKVMILGCLTWHGVGPIYLVDGNINADNIKRY